jgi:mannose-1-phosphate guanylyltransferase
MIQPENRGTAAGILLPLLHIMQLDPEAMLVVLPSDHGIASEPVLVSAILDATARARHSNAGLVLLGVQPERSEAGYGWIVPQSVEPGRLHPIAAFHEKPTPAAAASLFAEGALLNSFILIANGRDLADLIENSLPNLWRAFHSTESERPIGSLDADELARMYNSVPNLDFSKDLLEKAAGRLWVYPVPECGWTDLGVPERLDRHLADQRRHPPKRLKDPTRLPSISELWERPEDTYRPSIGTV